MKKFLISTVAVAGAILPTLAAAQGSQAGQNLLGIINLANNIINRLIPFVIALTVLVFLWGVFKFVLSTDADSRSEARGYMIWGIIALFVMVSVWGLVNILVNGLQLNNQAPNPPTYSVTAQQSN